MLELVFFLAVSIALMIYDLKKMRQANLKRELVPYLLLMLPAAAVALVYLINPLGPSLTYIIMRLFGIKE